MIAGVDYDTNRIVVCMLEWEDTYATGDGDPAFRTVEYRRGSKVDAFQGTLDAYRAMRRLLDDKAPRRTISVKRAVDVWWIEHAFGKGPTDFKLGRVQGAILAALARQVTNPIVNETPPPEWKKGVGLPGNARKADYVPVLAERIGLPNLSEHEVDSYGIALFGRIKNEQANA